jgi:DNA ligase-1
MYIHGIPFNEHNSFIMTRDITTREHSNKIKLALKKGELTRPYHYYMKLPDNFKFYIFDTVIDKGYCDRIDYLKSRLLPHNSYEIVDYTLLYNVEAVEEMYDKAIDNGYEGLVLRKPDGHYKFGRATAKEQLFLKLKPIENLSARCIGFTERMMNTNESFRDELGYLTKRNTIADKQETGIAATVICDYEGEEVKITLTGTEEYRRYIWENQKDYIGKMVNFKGMLYGSKNLPRQTIFTKFF